LLFQRAPQIAHEAFGDGGDTVAAALVAVALIERELDPGIARCSRW
jgi:hypothetical protein